VYGGFGDLFETWPGCSLGYKEQTVCKFVGNPLALLRPLEAIKGPVNLKSCKTHKHRVIYNGLKLHKLFLGTYTWKGESSVATVQASSIHYNGHGTFKMFDDNLGTYWSRYRFARQH